MNVAAVEKFFSIKPGQVNLHFDFEFIDNVASTGNLTVISFGAVLETDKGTSNLYMINKDFVKSEAFHDLLRKDDENSSWMRDNVFKHIYATVMDVTSNAPTKTASIAELWPDLKNFGHEKSPLSLIIKAADQPKSFIGTMGVGSIAYMGNALKSAIEATSKFKTKTVRPWAYYNHTDTECLHALFGGMAHVPESFSKYTFDLRSVPEIFGLNHDKFDPKGPHHPLLDAVEQHSVYLNMKKAIIGAAKK